MLCFVIGTDEDDVASAALRQLTEQLGYATAVAPSLAALLTRSDFTNAERPLVLVPDTAPGQPLLKGALDFAQAEQGRAFLVYIADTIAPGLYKQLVRTGSGEWVASAGMPGELVEIARRLAGRTAPSRAAKVVSCWPSKGGVGNSTIAVEIAVHLAGQRKRSGLRVAIFDLNFQGGTIPDLLDIEPRFDIGELMGRPERLDEQLTDVFTSRHSARLDVFASPIGPVDTAAIDPKIIFAFLDVIATRYDIILMDMSPHWLPWIDNVLLGSDAIIVSGASTVPAVKQLGAKLGRLDEIATPPAKVAVAVSGCDADLFGRVSRRGQIEKAFPGRQVFFIRRDDAAFDAAHDMGRPLMETAPNKRVTKDIKRLAEWVGTATDRSRPGAHS